MVQPNLAFLYCMPGQNSKICHYLPAPLSLDKIRGDAGRSGGPQPGSALILDAPGPRAQRPPKSEPGPLAATSCHSYVELQRLRRKVKQLREECESLAKAAA